MASHLLQLKVVLCALDHKTRWTKKVLRLSSEASDLMTPHLNIVIYAMNIVLKYMELLNFPWRKRNKEEEVVVSLFRRQLTVTIHLIQPKSSIIHFTHRYRSAASKCFISIGTPRFIHNNSVRFTISTNLIQHIFILFFQVVNPLGRTSSFYNSLNILKYTNTTMWLNHQDFIALLNISGNSSQILKS